jgi:hypothetical protein
LAFVCAHVYYKIDGIVGEQDCPSCQRHAVAIGTA